MEERHDYIALDLNQLSANEWIAAYDDVVAHVVTSTDGVGLCEALRPNVTDLTNPPTASV